MARATSIARAVAGAGCAAALAAGACAHRARTNRVPAGDPAPRRDAGGARVRDSLGGEVAPAAAAPAAPVRRTARPAFGTGRIVRVALAENAAAPAVSAAGAWTVVDGANGAVLARAAAGATWRVERRGAELRALGPAGGTSWGRTPLVVRPADAAAPVSYGGRPYRGELWLHAGPGGGLTVVNRLPAEDYLRGVVPLELRGRDAADHAAVEAQAVAARSYTYSRLAEFLPRAAAVARAQQPFDVRATVSDQVYGGAAAELPEVDRAVLATAGLVLRYDGMVVSAPYHASCGGSTAAPEEVWGDAPAPYLRAVSDRIGGGDRLWCDASPRTRWTRVWQSADLDAVLARYLRRHAAEAPGGGAVGAASGVETLGHTASGRASALAVRTNAGRFLVRGNNIRYVLRDRGGEILPSTYFSARAEDDGAGRLTRLELRGAGNGHGVGMCQWGAMGRSRAGQDFRTILRTYYPGTSVEPVE